MYRYMLSFKSYNLNSGNILIFEDSKTFAFLIRKMRISLLSKILLFLQTTLIINVTKTILQIVKCY